MTARARIQWVAVVAGCLAAASALADRSITVDGNASDWSGVPACFSEPTNDGNGGVELTTACVENDNASGDLGKLYTLYVASGSLPTNQDLYFGFAVDLNDDGQIKSGDDEVYAVVYPASGWSQWNGITLVVYDPNTYTFKRSYSFTSNCGGTSTSNGWSQSKNGSTVEIGISYGCLRKDGTGTPLTYGNDFRLFQMGVYPAFDTTIQLKYDGTRDLLWTPGTTPPSAGYPTVTARTGQNKLFWSNPVAHDGTLVVRHVGPWPTDTALSFTPQDGTTYSAGQTITRTKKVKKTIYREDYQVVFSDGQGAGASAVDTGLTNGTSYQYKVYNHYDGLTYASGESPFPGGIFGEPRPSAWNEPVWCYSLSATAFTAPMARDGVALTAGNGGAIVAVRNAPGSSTDGDEVWRPLSLNGAMQSGFTRVPLYGRTGSYIIVGTQNGQVAVVNPNNGTTVLSVAGASFGGNFIQAFIPVQLYSYANAAFKAAQPNRDLIFVPTRISGTNNYKVVALSSVNGSKIWESTPTSPILGGMLVDYANNRLYVPTSDSATSVQILSTLDGTLVGTLSVGAVSRGVTMDYYANGGAGQLIVVNDSGTAYGFPMNWTGTPTAASWNTSVGGTPVGLPMPISGGFVISVRTGTTTGAVNKITFSTAGAATTQSVSISKPSNPTFEIVNNQYTRVWVGSSDQKLHGIDFNAWTDVVQLNAPGTTPGTPSIDSTTHRIVAGTEDGRLCSFVVPP